MIRKAFWAMTRAERREIADLVDRAGTAAAVIVVKGEILPWRPWACPPTDQ